MNDQIKALITPPSGINPIGANNQQIVLMGGAIAGLNVFLMLFVFLYWTNPDFHTLLTGKPL